MGSGAGAPSSATTSEDPFLVRAPSVSLPKGGGAIKGIGEKFTTNPVTGTGSMSVPIAVSPGRGWFGPQLALRYDSGAGSGSFGLGWSLSLPSITRKTDKGLPRYLDDEDSDTFLLAGAEDLVPVADVGGDRALDEQVVVYGQTYKIRLYRPRVEGLFAHIERWSQVNAPSQVFWRTISRDNVTSWFGRTSTSRVHDPDDTSRIFEWFLCETYDDKGNVAVYLYKREDGADVVATLPFEANRLRRSAHANTYLERIRYGYWQPFLPSLAPARQAWQAPGSTPGDWMFEVVFDYGEYPSGTPHPIPAAQRPWPVRKDPFSSHRAGFEVRTWRLCRRVLMLHHFRDDPAVGLNCLVRSTDFHYRDPAQAQDPHELGYTVLELEDPWASGYSVLDSVTQRSYQRRKAADTTYESRELPPLALTYSEAEIDTVPHAIASDQLSNLPVGTQGAGYQWVDLDGEGLSGVLTDQAGAWHYRPNRGGGRFGPARIIAQVPALAALASGRQQLMDLSGDGAIDLVDFSGPVPGFHERDRDDGWKRHVPFASLPNVDWQDANLRFVDLTGDGHADALITEHEVFTWYPSLNERGFAAAQRTRMAADEDTGARLVFADGTQTLFLADMCGDGLTDMVRIRNGQVCYWPNLGYGRFGCKVTLANAPRFDSPDLFDPQRIRLADIDGSGPIDIVYLGRRGAQLYLNRSGNSLSNARLVALPVATENLGAVQVADLLGNGTACLVWNSHLPVDAAHPVRYIDLMGGTKPHLLTRIDNNLGGSTEIEYTPSTHFYLQDLAAGAPWITRLPFPVHCVSRVTVRDHWRDTEFSSTSSYHHGYFDGAEREFRGFGRVEQVDVERFGDPLADQAPVKTITWYHTGAALDRKRLLDQMAQEYFPHRYAERLPGAALTSAFRERPLPDPELPPDLTADEWREAHRAFKGMVLRQEVYELRPRDRIPVRLFSAATHNGRIARLQPRGTQRHAVFHVTESEALTYHYELALPNDGSPLQPDPRIAHTLNLRHDEYGNPQQSVSIGYGRWQSVDYPWLPRPKLAHEVQSETHIAYSEIRYTHDVRLDASSRAWLAPLGLALRYRRLRLPCETLTYELKSILKSGAWYYTPRDFTSLDLSSEYGHRAGEIAPTQPVVPKAYHDAGVGMRPQKRLVEHIRTRYFNDASETEPPKTPLPWRQHGPRGLKYEAYKLALTDGLLTAVFGLPSTFDPMADKLGWQTNPAAGAQPAQTARAVLANPQRSGYIDGPTIGAAAGEYWMRSGVAGFDANAVHAFFLPNRYTDPFGNPTVLVYGPGFLYVWRARDALGNVTCLERFDHRLLAPAELVDINGNHSEVVFDIHGLPAATAIKGKFVERRWQGDHLDAFRREDGSGFDLINPSAKTVADFCVAATMKEDQARDWLGTATARVIYHHGESRDAQGRPTWMLRMAGACSISRETHVSKLAAGEEARLQVALECSDGHGATLLRKAQAEPEASNGPLRWIVNGLTVLNNKGKPVKQYEPAFSARFGCELPGESGVSSTMFYDAPGRVVRTEFPDGTLSRVAFSPWHTEAWDQNDTVLQSRWLREGGRNSLALADELPRRSNGLTNATPDARAGWLARQHAYTPARTVLDSLGREVIAVAQNRVPSPTGLHQLAGKNWRDEYTVTFTKLDAEGKPLWIRDASGNLVMQYISRPKPTRWADQRHERVPAGSAPAYDIAGNLLYQHSMDAGGRWMLMDTAGKPMLAWDFNEQQDDAIAPGGAGTWLQEHRLYATDYDALHRPTAQWLRIWRRPRPEGTIQPPQPFQAQAQVMLDRFEYQSAVSDDPANLNGQLVRHFDASGLVQTVRRSFAGPVQEVRRQLVTDAKRAWTDWQAPLAANDTRLEADTYIQIIEHDALGRMTRHYNWHRAGAPVAVYAPAYNVRGLLHSETLCVRAQKTETGFVANSGRFAEAIKAIEYNARGQKTMLSLGNGTVTHYTYDRHTFRLTRMYTRRAAIFNQDCGENPPRTAAPATIDSPPFCGVQNLRYSYDPVGNITHIRDDAQPTIWFRNQQVEPHSDYAYDALYRLVAASGRESDQPRVSPPVAESAGPGQSVPIDGTLRRYTQRYVYDVVGNFVRMEHVAGPGSWTRHYAAAAGSNRLLRTWEGPSDWNVTTARKKTEYRYDPHGSMLNLAATPAAFDLHWDHRDMIRHIDLGGGGAAWYQYDSGKQRTRKRIVRNSNTSEERIYLGGFERYRRTLNGQVVEEIESHHLFEGERRVLLVDDVITATPNSQPGPIVISHGERTCWRYQYGNHLGSVGVELDEQARVISYEEFHPYGTAAYRLVNSAVQAPAKRYRYTGMERDEESGLNSHSLRYYSPHLCRWITVDPAWMTGGINLFVYAESNPIVATDPTGTQPEKSTWLNEPRVTLGRLTLLEPNVATPGKGYIPVTLPMGLGEIGLTGLPATGGLRKDESGDYKVSGFGVATEFKFSAGLNIDDSRLGLLAGKVVVGAEKSPGQARARVLGTLDMSLYMFGSALRLDLAGVADADLTVPREMGATKLGLNDLVSRATNPSSWQGAFDFGGRVSLGNSRLLSFSGLARIAPAETWRTTKGEEGVIVSSVDAFKVDLKVSGHGLFLPKFDAALAGQADGLVEATASAHVLGPAYFVSGAGIGYMFGAAWLRQTPQQSEGSIVGVAFGIGAGPMFTGRPPGASQAVPFGVGLGVILHYRLAKEK